MLKLYLVRHGESAWNVKHLYTGQTDVPLSQLGEIQAARVAGKLSGLSFDAVYASPLKRAHDTAKPIAAALEMPLRLDARLAEIHHGAWEGNPAAVIREQYADEYLAWRTQPHRVQMPDGESLEDVSNRVQEFLQEVLAEHSDGSVLIVSHDAVLRVIVLQTLLMGLEFFWRWRFDNASLSVVERMGDGHFRLALLNEVHHLKGVYTNCDAQAL
jgi:alpha-ribazole phosphatase